MKLNGMERLNKKLASGSSIRQDAAKVVQKHATRMNGLAQRNAPVDTGELRRSIRTGYSDGGLTATTKVGVHYGPYVEYGTRFMAAQPFLRPAFYNTAWDFKDDMDKLVK
ncbi:HK97-gp10 family putative phage morphogenesis protein [Edaphobacillus lindanitolerans]|uniref:Phage protein, HK97 gp10 family n=1 Tax=Edaphobacillus lindanitolerans TaxID=550447 RepID=A0A1U7PN14_9BACI|nr:HK97-gp10 family putative phage morphogenesis protein [Edaphobacillus lindanitolerans]SIT91699.1 phage protein, HK97 gp10 family [Edaphobacillus lindanitolerans]